MGNVDIHDVYKQIAAMAQQFDAERVVLFGSRARGTNGARSDIDLAIYGCSSFDRLQDALQEELWSLLTLDIIDMRKDVSEMLREEIERDGVVLYEKI